MPPGSMRITFNTTCGGTVALRGDRGGLQPPPTPPKGEGRTHEEIEGREMGAIKGGYENAPLSLNHR